jgi:hypothetical protein
MDRDKAEIPSVTPEAPRYRKRGRPAKPKLDLNVIDGGFSGAPKRPDPPVELNARQKQIWNEIVKTEPVDFFASQATMDLLKDLVCHRETIEGLNKVINSFKPEWLKNGEGMTRYAQYLKARGNETRHASLIATRLRLTNQSRYTPQAAATASRNSAKVRPWEEE